MLAVQRASSARAGAVQGCSEPETLNASIRAVRAWSADALFAAEERRRMAMLSCVMHGQWFRVCPARVKA